jgi:glutaminyl-tRNA synthetase
MSNLTNENAVAAATPAPSDFIRDIVAKHVAENKYPRIHTRFPPEPNGYLHIGHAKSICLNFGIAREFGGVCNLRMDDTNPTKEDIEYVESIQEDVNWLIGDWSEDRLGLKPKGKTPEAITGNGKRDFYLPPVFGTSEGERKNASVALEPFCLRLLRPDLRIRGAID